MPSTATTRTVTGLTNGTAYVFRVAAVNGIGTGAYSTASAAVTPRAATDAFYSSVVLLLNMNGTNGSTTFTDSSASAKTVTGSGNAAISTTQSKFGGASAVFDGTGDFLSVANNADFDFGSGDFTIEAWVYISANSAPDADGSRSATIINTWPVSGTVLSGYALNITGNNSTTGTGLAFDTWSGNSATTYRATVNVSQNTWHHVAVSVSGGTRRLFLNGVEASGSTSLVGSGYTQANSLGNAFRIGRTSYAGYPLDLNGFIDDLRVTKGVARYTANFTPPAAMPSVLGAFSVLDMTGCQLWLDASDASTLFNATTGGSLVAADGGVARWEDKSGNGRHFTQSTSGSRPARKTNQQNGLDALLFDGSNDHMIGGDYLDLNGTNQITVFLAIKARTSSVNSIELINKRDNTGTDSGWYFYTNSSGKLETGLVNSASYFVLESNSAVAAFNSGAVFTFKTTAGAATSASAQYRNGSLIASTVSFNQTQAAANVSKAIYLGILEFPTGTFARPFDGNFCEVIAYNSNLSDTTRALVENYLMSKWAIT